MINRSLEKTYQLSPAKLALMLAAQNWQCAICARSFRSISKRERHIDHDHRTGRVRGLLCRECNLLLGHARDDVMVLRGAIDHLERSRRNQLKEWSTWLATGGEFLNSANVNAAASCWSARRATLRPQFRRS
jgi:recombination endonuclease VII